MKSKYIYRKFDTIYYISKPYFGKGKYMKFTSLQFNSI